MSALRIMLSMALVVLVVSAVSAEEKKATNKEKIVGKWEVTAITKAGDAGIKVGDIVEFTKDGQMKSPKEADNAPYQVDGDMLTIKAESGLRWKIKTLTEKMLVIEAPGPDKKSTTVEFKKK